LRIETFRTGSKFKVGGVEVEPVHVDHSIPAAYAFIIHCSEATLVYTGDFRIHGTRPQLTKDFLESASREGPPDLLICEGTNISKAEIASEGEVKRKATEIVKNCNSLVIADFSETDFDRFRTMHQVAKDTGRELVIEARRAWVLNAINKCQGLAKPSVAREADIRIFDASKKRLSTYEKLLRQAMEKQMVDLEGRFIYAEDLHSNPSRYLLCTSFGGISTIQRVKPPPAGVYILSASEPFNEESEISFEKLLNWLALHGLAMYTTHSSGHIHPLQLKSSIEDMTPKTVLPIHTDAPLLFKRFLEPSGIRIQLPKPGKPYSL